MHNTIKFLLLAMVLFPLTFTEAQVTNFLANKDSIVFDGERYNLAWSSNPFKGYYKQEYLRSNDKLDQFNKMIIIEVIENANLESAVIAMVQKINERKKRDPGANYQLLENVDLTEYFLDFVLHEDGVFEWNAYRYMIYKDDKSKNTGVALFAFCIRGFPESEMDGFEFHNFLLNKREDMINKVLKFKVPEIKIAK